MPFAEEEYLAAVSLLSFYHMAQLGLIFGNHLVQSVNVKDLPL